MRAIRYGDRNNQNDNKICYCFNPLCVQLDMVRTQKTESRCPSQSFNPLCVQLDMVAVFIIVMLAFPVVLIRYACN